MTVTVFGYLILINIDLYDFISPFYFSLVLDSIEKINQNTQDSIWPHFQTHRNS